MPVDFRSYLVQGPNPVYDFASTDGDYGAPMPGPEEMGRHNFGPTPAPAAPPARPTAGISRRPITPTPTPAPTPVQPPPAYTPPTTYTPPAPVAAAPQRRQINIDPRYQNLPEPIGAGLLLLDRALNAPAQADMEYRASSRDRDMGRNLQRYRTAETRRQSALNVETTQSRPARPSTQAPNMSMRGVTQVPSNSGQRIQIQTPPDSRATVRIPPEQPRAGLTRRSAITYDTVSNTPQQAAEELRRRNDMRGQRPHPDLSNWWLQSLRSPVADSYRLTPEQAQRFSSEERNNRGRDGMRNRTRNGSKRLRRRNKR